MTCDKSYFRTDTQHDAVQSLLAAAHFLRLADEQPHYWKWFVAAVHSALQGAFAAALKKGDALAVQKPSVAQKMLAHFQGNGNFPEPHMDNFTRLFLKVQDAANLRPGVAPYRPSDEVSRAVEILNEMRDDFIHFNSKSWSIEIQYITENALLVCDVVLHLLVGSGSVLWYEDHLKTLAADGLKELEQRLRTMVPNGQPA